MKRFLFLIIFFLNAIRVLFAQSDPSVHTSRSPKQSTQSSQKSRSNRPPYSPKRSRLGYTPNYGTEVTEKFSIDSGKVLLGVASYYHDKFEGRKTSNGEIFDQNKLTAASNIIPLGTWIRIVNPQNDSSVVVFINDRMHPKNRRLVDLSKAAAKQLGSLHFGLIRVRVELLGNSLPLIIKN